MVLDQMTVYAVQLIQLLALTLSVQESREQTRVEHVLCSTIWIGFTVGCLGRQILSIAFRADAPSGDTKLLSLVVTGFDDVVVVVVVTCRCLLLVACCSLLVLREPKVKQKSCPDSGARRARQGLCKEIVCENTWLNCA